MNVHSSSSDYEIAQQSVDVEQQLLGAVLMSNDVWHPCSERVEAEHFYEPAHQRLWTIISDRIGSGGSCTPVQLVAVLGGDAGIELAGVTVKEYIARLAAEATTISHAPDMASMVRDLWARRQVIRLARDIQARALGVDGSDITALLEDMDAELGAIRYGKQVSGVSSIGELAERSIAQTEDAFKLDGRAGFSTGIASIDEMIGPMMPGDLVTVLAPSGHGKSALGAQILWHNCQPSLDANRGVPGLYESMEMEGAQVARRHLATETGIATRAQKSGEIVQGEYERLRDKAAEFKRIPYYVDASGRQKVSGVVKKLRHMKRKYGIRIAVIDHVKLFRPENPKQNKFDVIELAAFELKDAAKELEMLIILLAQVTRESQKRDGWRVHPSDLFGGEVVRETSDIMLTACLPYRWLVENEPSTEKEKGKWDLDCGKWFGHAEIAAPKVRDGESGAPRMVKFNGQRMLFSDV